ncbi:hypothetical protein QBC39DRAFT_353116 [Podospora conica]|nr:hypothetical protein QBC39DRAFT_353116 [Schizothecium conicum]
MPYSDNLYSLSDDDESDIEPTVSDGLNHPGSGLRGDTGAASHSLGTEVDDEEAALSPTDGYFQSSQTESATASANVSRVPNIWVQDPSLAPNSTESKAHEAARERTTDTQQIGQHRRQSIPTIYRYPEPTSPLSAPRPDAYHQQSSSTHAPSGPWPTTSYTPYRPQQIGHDRGPSFIPAEAPPPYTPSRTSPSTASPTASGDVSANYSTFSPTSTAPSTAALMGGHEESQGLLSREPQSMGHPDDERQHGSPPWHGRARRYLFMAGLLFMVFGFLCAALTAGSDQHGTYPPKRPSQKNPVPFDPPTDIDNPPPMETPGLSPNFPWADRSCKRAQISRDTREFDVSFANDKTLTITQDIEKGEHHRVSIGVQGSIVFREAYPDNPNPSVVVETVVNYENLDVSVNWDATSQSLTVTVPPNPPWDSSPSSRPCISIGITVYVPPSSTLQTLTVTAVHLDIALLDNLSLSVLSSTTLQSTIGRIVSASTGSPAQDSSLTLLPSSYRFHSTAVQAKTVSGPIYGAWPLAFHLALTTLSGAITVHIAPVPGDGPATLTATTASGAITLRSPIHAAQKALALSRYLGAAAPHHPSTETLLPPRDYHIAVQTQSGAIRASLPFSSTATFQSTSGTSDIELLPVLASDSAALRTASVSGLTRVTVAEPLWVEAGGKYSTERGRPLRGLVGQHEGTSADLVLAYPGSWEGEIGLETMTGRLSARGRGVEVVRVGRGWRRELVARKGGEGGGGRILGEVTSGDVEVLVGDV